MRGCARRPGAIVGAILWFWAMAWTQEVQEVPWPMLSGGPGRTGCFTSPGPRLRPIFAGAQDATHDDPALTIRSSLRCPAPGQAVLGFDERDILNLLSSPICSGAAQAGRIVCFGTADAQVHAVHLGSCRLLWSVRLAGPVLGDPLPQEPRVYVASEPGEFLALDLASGIQRWKVSLAGRVQGSPALYEGGLVLVGDDRGNLHAVEADTGRLRWVTRVSGAILGTPAVSAGTAFVATATGQVSRLNVGDGTVLWQVQAGGSFAAGLAFDPALDLLALGTREGQLYAFDGRGRVWPGFPLSLDGAESLTPLLSAGVIFLPTRTRFYAVDAARAEVICEHELRYGSCQRAPAFDGRSLWLAATKDGPGAASGAQLLRFDLVAEPAPPPEPSTEPPVDILEDGAADREHQRPPQEGLPGPDGAAHGREEACAVRDHRAPGRPAGPAQGRRDRWPGLGAVFRWHLYLLPSLVLVPFLSAIGSRPGRTRRLFLWWLAAYLAAPFILALCAQFMRAASPASGSKPDGGTPFLKISFSDLATRKEIVNKIQKAGFVVRKDEDIYCGANISMKEVKDLMAPMGNAFVINRAGCMPASPSFARGREKILPCRPERRISSFRSPPQCSALISAFLGQDVSGMEKQVPIVCSPTARSVR